MGAASGRALGWPYVLAPLVALLAGGCLGRPRIDQDLLARKVAVNSPALATGYVVHFPDVLDVQVEGRPDWSGRRPVHIDGRIDAGPAGVRAEGHTVPEIARSLAEQAGVPLEAVRLTVAEYNSQQRYLHGE